MPSEQLLESSGLLPFAVLSQTNNRESVLQGVASRIEANPNKTEQSNLAASTAILAGLVLDKSLVNRLLREEIMKESVIYQEIQAVAEARGRQEGRQEGESNLVLRQLNKRIGTISPELTEQIRNLSVEQLESLGEALLDFQSFSDLVNWLEPN